MPQKLAQEVFKPIKPSSVKTDGERSDAWEEYRAEQQAVIDRMAEQRRHRLNAAELLKIKKGG